MSTVDFIITNPLGQATLLSPWMTRQSDNVRLSYEVVAMVGGAGTFDVEVYHKASNGTGPGTQLTVSWAGSGPCISGTATGLKELWRLKFILTGSGTGEPDACFYRVLPPTWFNQSEGSA